MGKSDQLGTHDVLWSTCLVDCDVGHRTARNRVARMRETRQREHVCSRATEHRTHDYVVVEQRGHLMLETDGEIVAAVGQCMALVGTFDGLENCGMRARQVVRCELTLRGRRVKHPLSITVM